MEVMGVVGVKERLQVRGLSRVCGENTPESEGKEEGTVLVTLTVDRFEL